MDAAVTRPSGFAGGVEFRKAKLHRTNSPWMADPLGGMDAAVLRPPPTADEWSFGFAKTPTAAGGKDAAGCRAYY
jgi:hypothetical protein